MSEEIKEPDKGAAKTKFDLRHLIKRRPDRFTMLLISQAELTMKGMNELVAYFDKPNKKRSEAVSDIEREADEVRRILIDELNHTFVTPFDREDIHSLSRAIDDMLDYGYTSVEEMSIFEVSPTPQMHEIGVLLANSAREIYLGVQRIKDNPGVAQSHVVRAKHMENQVEDLYRQALAELFCQANDVDHIIQMLKLRECYRHLSNAADRGDEAANILCDIVVKIG